jgi:hypothetical protein
LHPPFFFIHWAHPSLPPPIPSRTVESLAESPAIMTHASVPIEVRQQLGIDDTLVRLSVGIEALPDLIADLDGALKVGVGRLVGW